MALRYRFFFVNLNLVSQEWGGGVKITHSCLVWSKFDNTVLRTVPYKYRHTLLAKNIFCITMSLFRCTGSWRILARGGEQLRKCHFGKRAILGKCQLGNLNLSDFLGTIFIFNSYLNYKYSNMSRTPPRTLILINFK